MESLWSDLRHAVRQMRRRPVFALVAVLSLAIGVGANTAIFNAVSAVLLRPVSGVREPDRVVEVGRTSRGRGFDTFAYPDYEDIREGASAFQATAAYMYTLFSLSRGGEGERITGMHVEPAYFDVMGVRPERGRFFTAQENAPGSRPTVVVLSHSFWVDRFGGEPDILGSTVRIDRIPFTVVGIVPADFHGHTIGFQPDVYVPLRAIPLLQDGRDDFSQRGASWHNAVARLAPGATVQEADTQVKGVFARLAEAYPDTNARRSGAVVPLGLVPGAGRAPVQAFMGVLMAMVGLILLVTCANVAGMFVARASVRQKEIAVRLALGAGRGRLVRQLLTEALAIFAVGGVAGTALGVGVLAMAPIDRLPVPIPIHVDLSADWRVLLFALGVTLLTGVVFGLLPALQATRLSLVASLKDDGSGRSGSSRLRKVFVAGQVGFSLVLLTGAGLLLRSLQRASEVESGFDPSDAYLTMVDLSLEGYGPGEGLAFQHRLVEHLDELPQVERAALSIDLPLDMSSHGTAAYPEGWDDGDGRGGLGVDFNIVSPGYFETLRVPLLRGRAFDAGDVDGSEPVAIVSRAFADRVWPGEDVVGRRLRFGTSDAKEPLRTIIGVVEDVKNQMITDAAEPFVYVPAWQKYRADSYVVVRAGGGIAQVAPLLRRSVLDVDPSLSLTPVISLARYTGIGTLPQRVAASITSALGLLALLLSGIGVYGVVAVAVQRRTREIGVRMALGAGRRRVLGLVLRGGLGLALPGLVIGGLAALAVGRAMRFMLLGLSPVDPVALGGVATALLGVVLIASLVPARRAAAVEPSEALRSE